MLFGNYGQYCSAAFSPEEYGKICAAFRTNDSDRLRLIARFDRQRQCLVLNSSPAGNVVSPNKLSKPHPWRWVFPKDRLRDWRTVPEFGGTEMRADQWQIGVNDAGHPFMLVKLPESNQRAVYIPRHRRHNGPDNAANAEPYAQLALKIENEPVELSAIEAAVRTINAGIKHHRSAGRELILEVKEDGTLRVMVEFGGVSK